MEGREVDSPRHSSLAAYDVYEASSPPSPLQDNWREPPPIHRTRYARRSHTATRAMERFGIDVSPDDYERFVNEIRTGRAAHLFNLSAERSAWRVQATNKDRVVAIYDRIDRVICTFMPNRWAKRQIAT